MAIEKMVVGVMVAAGMVRVTLVVAREMRILPLGVTTAARAETLAQDGTALPVPGKKPRVWATPHFAPSVMPWNTRNWLCASWLRRRMVKP